MQNGNLFLKTGNYSALAMAKIVYACARFTCLKKRLPQSYVGKGGYLHSESETSKMRAKMVVQPCSRFTSLFDTKMLI